MTTNDFLLRYWKYYIQIEKEFSQTTNYVSIDSINFNTYSDAYMKLLLQIGSEIDISCKLLCELVGYKLKNGSINKYKEIIISQITDYCNVRIREKLSGLNTRPWEEWKFDDVNPTWWTIYNKIKHHRTSSGSINGIKQEYYKFANLKYTLFAMMGLYQVLIHCYYYLAKAEGNQVIVPLPASRLFETESSFWKGVDFGTSFVISVDDGSLYMSTALFEY